jgi:hypothetical protein
MKLKKRTSPLKQIFKDPSLVYEAQKLISDGDEVDRLIEKTIEAYKMSWNLMKQIDKRGAYLLIYSAKVKKRFVNLLFNDAQRTINLLIHMLNKSLIMEFEATQMTSQTTNFLLSIIYEHSNMQNKVLADGSRSNSVGE